MNLIIVRTMGQYGVYSHRSTGLVFEPAIRPEYVRQWSRNMFANEANNQLVCRRVYQDGLPDMDKPLWSKLTVP